MVAVKVALALQRLRHGTTFETCGSQQGSKSSLETLASDGPHSDQNFLLLEAETHNQPLFRLKYSNPANKHIETAETIQPNFKPGT